MRDRQGFETLRLFWSPGLTCIGIRCISDSRGHNLKPCTILASLESTVPCLGLPLSHKGSRGHETHDCVSARHSSWPKDYGQPWLAHSNSPLAQASDTRCQKSGMTSTLCVHVHRHTHSLLTSDSHNSNRWALHCSKSKTSLHGVWGDADPVAGRVGVHQANGSFPK